MTGKSPKIESKFKLNYQFILKILNNKEQDLDRFIGKSLLSQDDFRTIQNYQSQLSDLESFDAGFAPGEYSTIKKYYQALKMVENARGNQKRKEQDKLTK